MEPWMIFVLACGVAVAWLVYRSVTRPRRVKATTEPGSPRPVRGPWIEWPRAEEFEVHSPLLVDDEAWFDVLPTLDEARKEIERWINREGSDVDALRLSLAAFLGSAFVPPAIFDSQPLPDGRQVETRFSYDPASGRLLGLWSRSVEGSNARALGT